MALTNGPLAGAAATGPELRRPVSRLKALLIAMVALSLALGAVFGRHGLLEARQYRLERDRLRVEIADAKRANAAMESELVLLRTDPTAVERIAREELGLVRPGEKLILLGAAVRHDAPLVPSAPGLDAVQAPP